MAKISRREKKLTREAMSNLDNARKRDQMMAQDPTKSYKRKIIHTKMPWPLELINMGRTDIVLLIIILIAIIIVAVALGIWFLVNWLLGVLV